jgi:hypothetical protein
MPHEIENEKAHVAEAILDVVAEHEQVQHVRGDVEQAAMQEHAGEQRGPGQAEWWGGPTSTPLGILDRNDTRGFEQVVERGVALDQHLEPEDHHVEDDEGQHDPRVEPPFAGVVLDRDHLPEASVY